MRKFQFFSLALILFTFYTCSTDNISGDITSADSHDLLKANGKVVERPFKAIGSGDYAISPGDGQTCQALVLNASGGGDASHLGEYTVDETWCWSGAPDDLGVRSTKFVAANGDELYAMPISVLFTAANVFQEEVLITGGTGRFENAEGSFLNIVETTDTSPFGGTFVLTISGVIKY